MVVQRNDGGPAFPVPHDALVDSAGGVKGWAGEYGPIDSGMTLRDYFAAKALVGISAHPGGLDTAQEWARLAYHVADLMLKERTKP